MWNNFLDTLLYLLSFIGVVISILGLPGSWIIYACIFIWSGFDEFVHITALNLFFLILIPLFSSVIDNIAMIVGAKKYGTTKIGILGGILGMVVGLVLGNIIGMVIGAFLGVYIFEMILTTKSSQQALKASMGTLVGYLSGNFIKFLLSLLLVFLWWFLAH